MNHKIIDKVASYIEAENMVTDGDRIVVGLSGGADSVCLLFLLYELKAAYNLSLCAVHIHHGIREEAGEDADFSKKICERFEIPIVIVKEDVPKLASEWKVSEEEAGRRVRYEAFERVAIEQGYNKIAVAHNRNDEAETVLFHMFRGSGLHGLTGIPTSRRQGKLLVIRPILCLTRDEIEAVLLEEGLHWITDRTNLEDIYARNRIRHNILPQAEAVSGGAVRHICEAAAQLKETEELLESLEEECYRECLVKEEGPGVGPAKKESSGAYLGQKESCGSYPEHEEGFEQLRNRITLSASRLSGYHKVIIKRTILRCLKEVTGGGRDIGMLQVEQVRGLVENSGNRSLDLARGVTAVRSYDNIVIFRDDEKIGASQEAGAAHKGMQPCVAGPSPEAEALHNLGLKGLNEDAKDRLRSEIVQVADICDNIDILLETVASGEGLNKYTKWLDYDKIDGQPVVRTREPGDYITVLGADGSSHKKSLKDYMIDSKIPSAERGRIPVVAVGNHCLWLVGYRISECCKLTRSSERVIKMTYFE